MRERDLLSRRQFIKTLAAGAAIAGAGAAGLSVVMKAAGLGRRFSFRGVGTRNLAAGKDYCKLCEKCLPCPQGTATRRAQRRLFSQQKRALAKGARRFSPEPVAEEKADRCIECNICEAKCPFAEGRGAK